MLACADPLYCACLISLGLLGNTDTLIRRRNAQARGGQTIIQCQVNGQHSQNHAEDTGRLQTLRKCAMLSRGVLIEHSDGDRIRCPRGPL
ncbi:hypothetical protein EDB19DRAFT_1395554 [Suillus lakei]|nr:hypothetical protein EDB19DRAFT_1395554 [Suillus lakei]